MNSYLPIYSLLFLLILFNIYATYRCFVSDFSDKKQKQLQFIFIWLVPIIGAALVVFMSKPMNTDPGYKTSDASDTVKTHPAPSESFDSSGD